MNFVRGVKSACIFSLLAKDAFGTGRCEGDCQWDLMGRDHVLLQQKMQKTELSKSVAAGCTSVNRDPYSSGSLVECCAGSERKVGQWSSSRSDWYYLCKPNGGEMHAEPCTKLDQDPYESGSFVKCCAGLEKRVGKWSQRRSDWYWLCKREHDSATQSPEPMPVPTDSSESQSPEPTPVPTDSSESRIMQWNVHWQNKDTAGIASVVKPNNADIVGLCEVTTSVQDIAVALSTATGRRYKVQPGREGWVGYGADIFYDDGKWEGLEGGVKRAVCSGSRGGPRAANWVVLKERSSGKVLITGGTHTSYCSGGCDELHACELTEMYDKFDEMKRKYHNAPVVWMGDVNRNIHSTVMRNLIDGSIGRRLAFKVDDLAKTRTNTYYTGGSAIDHIMGEQYIFDVIVGGSTGQGVRGKHLKGSDHFPIYAHVRWS